MLNGDLQLYLLKLDRSVFSESRMVSWLRLQQRSINIEAENERDSKNGHLTYDSGDILEDRCRCRTSGRAGCSWNPTTQINLTSVFQMRCSTRWEREPSGKWCSVWITAGSSSSDLMLTGFSAWEFMGVSCDVTRWNTQRRKTSSSEDHQELGEIQRSGQAGDKRSGENPGQRSWEQAVSLTLSVFLMLQFNVCHVCLCPLQLLRSDARLV